MTAFKCDGVIYCAKCYLEIIQKTKYVELVLVNTAIINVVNEMRCEDCNELCSNMESLNSLKGILNAYRTKVRDTFK